MIKRKSSYAVETIENMRGGDGAVTIEKLLTPDEMYQKGRLYAKITLLPGSSIGYHLHEGEMESFYVISGDAEYQDCDETVTLRQGDTALTLSGEGHSIKCIGDNPLEIIAQILFQ